MRVEKGIFDFLKMFGKLSMNAELSIVSDVKNLKNMNKKINLLGFGYDAKSLIEIYDSHNIMVLPSYREGMSRALLEAAAMEMPIISSDVPGCREVVNDSVNGYLVKVRDSDDLTIKLKKLISLSAIELKCMGEESRRLVKDKFSEELVIKKYIDAVDELFT